MIFACLVFKFNVMSTSTHLQKCRSKIQRKIMMFPCVCNSLITIALQAELYNQYVVKFMSKKHLQHEKR